MRKKFDFCGIFATMFVAATIFTVSSCSQDDDYYESDMYTMAEPLETRAVEGGGGGTVLLRKDTMYTQYIFQFRPAQKDTAWVFGSTIDLRLFRANDELHAEIMAYGTPTPFPEDATGFGFFSVKDVYFTPSNSNPLMNEIWVSAEIGNNSYEGTVENILFH